MITYNWKAEFSQKQAEQIEWCKQHRTVPPKNEVSRLHIIAEMANALDRYEAILNEMENKLDHITNTLFSLL